MSALNLTTCPHCGASVSANAKFCGVCGKPIERVERPPTPPSTPTPATALPSQTTCPHCGVPISPAAKFCGACGKTIAHPEPHALSTPPAAGAFPNLDQSSCPHCGAAVPANAHLCKSCGKPITTDAISAPRAAIPPSERKCPHCGEPLSETAKFCKACGKPVTSSAAQAPAGAMTPPLPQGGVSPRPAKPSAHPAAPPAKKRGALPLALAFGGVGVVCVCAAIGLVVLLGASRGNSGQGAQLPPSRAQSSATSTTTTQPRVPVTTAPAIAPQIAFTPINTTEATANGRPVSDEKGTTLVVPTGAAPADKKMRLIASSGSGPLSDQLARDFNVTSPYYTVAMAGEEDGIGSAELGFAAPDPSARVAMIVDRRYVGLLEVHPQSGRLAVQAPLLPGVNLANPAEDQNRRQYVVLSPKATSRSLFETFDPLGALVPAAFAASGNKDCDPTAKARQNMSYCRSDGAGTVLYFSNLQTFVPGADKLIDTVVSYMGTLNTKFGFTNAKLSAGCPMVYVIDPAINTPMYSPMRYVTYLPPDAPMKIGETSNEGIEALLDLQHESFHALEHKSYHMKWEGLKGRAPLRDAAEWWWLEMAAENALFLVDGSQATLKNLAKYGNTEQPASQMLGWQLAPYNWDGEKDEARYIQAQLVLVNMCDKAKTCPISQKTFAQAINDGTFPFKETSNQAMLTANLDEYAQYVLGKSPFLANSGIPLTDPVLTGNGIGDELYTLTAKHGIDTLYGFLAGTRTASFVGKKNPIQDDYYYVDKVEIDTKIAKDAIYPLLIGSGKRGTAGLPVYVSIPAGVEAWVRVGTQPISFKKAATPLFVAPISENMGGSPVVRIVGVGTKKDTPFKVTTGLVDLTGDWELTAGQILSKNPKCNVPGSENSDVNMKPDKLSEMHGRVQSFAGHMDPSDQRTPNVLQFVSGNLFVPLKNKNMRFTFEVTLDPQSIRVNSVVTIPKDEFFQSKGVPYGQVQSKYDFKKLEYIGSEDVKKPVWLLSQGVVTSTFQFTGLYTDPASKTQVVATCSNTVTYDLTAKVYREGTLTEPWPSQGGGLVVTIQRSSQSQISKLFPSLTDPQQQVLMTADGMDLQLGAELRSGDHLRSPIVHWTFKNDVTLAMPDLDPAELSRLYFIWVYSPEWAQRFGEKEGTLFYQRYAGVPQWEDMLRQRSGSITNSAGGMELYVFNGRLAMKVTFSNP